jgi:acetylornithine/N-succinyldiaminopimelate aminotransferase
MTSEGAQTEDMSSRWNAVMMRNYGTPPIALAHGEGCTVWDVDGKSYLDLVGGIAVSTLGHSHPAIADAVSSQSRLLIHTSNLAMHEPGLALAERLVDLLGLPGRVFFSQDGATANEAAYKIARKHGWAKDPSGGSLEIVAAEGSFHGRTLGALSVTGSPGKRQPFEPLPGPVTFVPYGDSEALEGAVTERTAAVFLEPVQGEAGVVLPPPGYLADARTICDRANALLVVDEVQSGIGRTGDWFAVAGLGVAPDVITLAKGLAGGMPMGACIGIGPAGELLQPGDHGSTFGGNPVAAAAALAVLDTIERENLLSSVTEVGSVLSEGLDNLDHPLIAGHRGTGLWRGVILSSPKAVDAERAARARGFLINAVRPDVLRVAPPLIVTDVEVRRFLAEFPAILDDTWPVQRAESGRS